ncbi:histone-fold-containing protein [Coprinellus micaceus]|uniref:Histone H2A n=1 Tax=Coprinellus micaceus TaxID=71717 RepID=A0A4Y7SIV9_COPMI|nr:histone-fold-containing protein [Coprinellus micaceus]
MQLITARRGAPRTTLSAKAGIVFPAARVHRKLKEGSTTKQRVSPSSAVYLATVLEYLVAEVLEASGNSARQVGKVRITPRHLLLAVGNDDELLKLLPSQHIIIAQGGTSQFQFQLPPIPR